MWSGWRLRRGAEVAFLALVAYLPMLLSSPGRVSADSKQALFIDPGQFLSRAVNMWDPSFGAGTVPHQHIGYLWPMGPWFWVSEWIGLPVWVAQRLWLGTLVFAAALGARWLLRSLGTTSFVATCLALVYALTPYQLAFTARASVLLLPWVGLPWLIELTRRSLQHQRWRHPALFGLTVGTVAGVNATSLALVGLGPLLVLIHALFQRPWRQVAATTLRLGLVSIAVSAWWLVGLLIQGSHGLPVLHLTENLTDIARWSLPGDVLRGLGNWFFAGRDRLGFSVDQAELYLDNEAMVAITLILPVVALGIAILARGSVRLFALATVVVAMIVGVGAWPVEQPTGFGRAFAWFVEETSIGLALRNSHRIVPLLVLGVMLLLAVGIQQLVVPRWRSLIAAGIGALALLTMGPVLVQGFLSEHLDRSEELPAEWLAAAEDLDQRGSDDDGNPYRVLEVPGSPFAAYRWGNTVEPILPSLIDRPHVAREVLPYGSLATANLLDAFDRRIQEGVLEPATVAPIARLFAASDVVVRSDLAFERFGSPEPAGLWRTLSDAVDLTLAGTFGAPRINAPDPRLRPISESDLHYEALAGASPPLVGGEVSPIGVLSVEDAPPLLQASAPTETLILAGDGDGVVDAAGAGLIDGRAPILYADALSDEQLDRVLDRGATLVLTDSNRRRIQTWFYAIRDTRGPTERAGETIPEPSGYDYRISPFGPTNDSSRSVVQHIGAQVSASASAGSARPDDRAVAAVDGDLATSWRIGGPDPRGHRLTLNLDQDLTLDRITIIQPLDGPRDRVLEEVRLHTDGQPPLDIALGPASLTPGGQEITFPARTISKLELEITSVSQPPFDPALANAVGIAELRLGELIVAETVRMPTDMLDRVGSSSAEAGLDVVMTRLRYDPFDRSRVDTERHLDRTFDLPAAREFGLSGQARINPRAPDSVLDSLLGTEGAFPVTASSRLVGDLSARARSAFDGRPDTAWTAAFGDQIGQWIEIDLGGDQPHPQIITVTMAVDELHSAPARLRVEADGQVVAHHPVKLPPAGPPGTTHTESIELPPFEGRSLRVVVDEIRRLSAPPDEPAVMATLPVAITEIELDHQPNPPLPSPPQFDTGCRPELVTINDVPISIRVTGSSNDLRAGLDIEPCDDDLSLDAGSTRVVSVGGHRSGIDIDRLVLSSSPEGLGRAMATRGGIDSSATSFVWVDARATRWSAQLRTDGKPFWLIMAQSENAGWEVEIDGATVGERTLIDGYANGWWVEPATAGTLEIRLDWTPQRWVRWGLALSLLSAAVMVGFVLGGRPLVLSPEASDSQFDAHAEPADSSSAFPWQTVVTTAILTGIFIAVIAPAWMGVVGFVVVITRAVIPRSDLFWATTVPVLVGATLLMPERPNLVWLAIAISLAGVLGAEAAEGWDGFRSRWREGASAPPGAPAPRTPHPIASETVDRLPRGPET